MPVIYAVLHRIQDIIVSCVLYHGGIVQQAVRRTSVVIIQLGPIGGGEVSAGQIIEEIIDLIEKSKAGDGPKILDLTALIDN